MKKKRTSPDFTFIDDRTAVFGFLAFLVIVLFLFDSISDQRALYAPKNDSAAASQVLTRELADQVVSKLTIQTLNQDDVAFIVKDTVDPQLLDSFASMDYSQVKAHLGLQSEFVLHFEDQAGMVIPMGNKMCIGSSDAKVNGIPCS